MWRPCSKTQSLLVSRFPVCYLWNLYHIRFNPSHLGLLKEAIKKYHWFLRMLPSAALLAAASWLAFLQPNCLTAPSHQTINIFWVSNIIGTQPRPSAFFGCPTLYKHTRTNFDLNLHDSFTNLGVWLSSSQMVSHRMERCAFQFDHCSEQCRWKFRPSF